MNLLHISLQFIKIFSQTIEQRTFALLINGFADYFLAISFSTMNFSWYFS